MHKRYYVMPSSEMRKYSHIQVLSLVMLKGIIQVSAARESKQASF